MVYHAAFRAVANMYRLIHSKYIRTGVRIVYSLGIAHMETLRNVRLCEFRLST